MKISGELFQKSVINGALNLKANVKIVNGLNVFPIPDGDTGENMYMTISGGVENMKSSVNNFFSCSSVFAFENNIVFIFKAKKRKIIFRFI